MLRSVEADFAHVVGAVEQVAKKGQLVVNVARHCQRMKSERNADAIATAELGVEHLEARRQLRDGDADDAGALGRSDHRRRVVEAVEMAVAVDEQTQAAGPPAATASRSGCPAPAAIQAASS